MVEDVRLLESYARRGDVESLSALVLRHTTWMKAYFRGQLSSEADVEDVFQETWLKVVRSCGSYRGGSVRAYLACVARSVLIDRYRRNGRLPVSLDAVDDVDVEFSDRIVDAAPTPGQSVERAANLEEVKRAVRTLPEGPRQVFLLRLEGELTFEEIARMLKVPLGTALTWMRTATMRLKRQIGGEE